eukprot:m.44171 g.44171  ORF g.44171 m.44171 type:complete len:375 (+) comp10062_c0_seq1:147-1271(+)
MWLLTLLLPSVFSVDGGSSLRSVVYCNGTIADTAAIQTAIKQSSIGDVVLIQGPLCLIAETIELLSGRSYMGGSRTGTVLKMADNSNLQAVVASDAWLQNESYTGGPLSISRLSIDGNYKTNQNSNTTGLVIMSWQSTIEEIHIGNTGGDGLRVSCVAKGGAHLKTSQVNGRISNVFIENTGGDGIRIQDPENSCTDWNMLDNWISTPNGSAINMDNAAGWQIRGNHVYGVSKHAIYANRCFATSIMANYIEDFGAETINGPRNSTYYGIACNMQGSAASVISDNKIFMFEGDCNNTANSQYMYIAVPKVFYGVGMLSVTGNVIRGNNCARDVGLSYTALGKSSLVVMSHGNLVYEAGTAMTTNGNVTIPKDII